MEPWITVAVCLAAYLLGSLPSGLVVARLRRDIDIRRSGSGNIGAANVYRVAGAGPAALTLLLDAAKGCLPVLAGLALGLPRWSLLLVGIAAVAGHNWSIFLGGRGGKGIATSLGVLAGIAPPVAPLAMLVWLAAVAGSRYASLASLLMMASIPVLLILFGYTHLYWLFGLALLGLALWRHRANVGRLIAGTELKLTLGTTGTANPGSRGD